MKKMIAILMVIISVMIMLPSSALAASTTHSGTGTSYYTITTKNKTATLTLTPKTGKRAQDYVLKSKESKKHTVTQSVYAKYTVTVDGESYTVTNKKVTVKLSPNSTYHICVSYNGISGMCFLYYSGTLFNPSWKWKTKGDEYWKTNPSVKLNVNNWASLE